MNTIHKGGLYNVHAYGCSNRIYTWNHIISHEVMLNNGGWRLIDQWKLTQYSLKPKKVQINQTARLRNDFPLLPIANMNATYECYYLNHAYEGLYDMFRTNNLQLVRFSAVFYLNSHNLLDEFFEAVKESVCQCFKLMIHNSSLCVEINID